jgi:hypothetical protein
MKASDIFKARPRANVLVYGDSGTGKTWWSAKSPLPFHLLCEGHALASVNASSPNNLVHEVESLDDLYRVISDLKRGVVVEHNGQAAYKFKHYGEYTIIQTVVLDSLTQVNEMIKSHHTGSKAKLGFDEWGRIQTDMRILLEDLRSLPVSLVCLALRYVNTDDSGRVLGYGPELYGKARSFAPSYFSAVGVSGKKADPTTGETRYAIGWDANPAFVSKQFPIPNGIEFPKVTYCSLGSILMALHPGLETVPRTASDSIKHVCT